jgi:hypothetical protein
LVRGGVLVQEAQRLWTGSKGKEHELEVMDGEERGHLLYIIQEPPKIELLDKLVLLIYKNSKIFALPWTAV